jgi:glycosyltransferase involved in cell wall biosynthesis
MEFPIRITSLPLRIDPSRFFFRKRSITAPVQFIHIAYYSPVKDQDTMFRAFAQVSKQLSCHLTVVGEGYEAPAIQRMLLGLNIADKITFAGLVPQSDIPQYLDRAHIMLHPARYETGCAVIQEAMASGVAVCGTDVGLLSDIGNRYAVIVPPCNVEALALGIVELVHDRKKFESITDAAHDWIVQQDAAWSARNYKEYLTGVIMGSD